jgi:uncharacterized Zn-binding protein involved in type VI secretion
MSQPVTRKGDKTTGHGPWQPRPSTGASGDVFANNIGVVREGDTWAPHNGSPSGRHKGETGYTSAGSGTVFANNKNIGRIGDAYGSETIISGSSNVFANS